MLLCTYVIYERRSGIKVTHYEVAVFENISFNSIDRFIVRKEHSMCFTGRGSQAAVYAACWSTMFGCFVFVGAAPFLLVLLCLQVLSLVSLTLLTVVVLIVAITIF